MNDGDEAKQFLDQFLARLLESDQTNQDLVNTLTLSIQQQERLIQQQQRLMQRLTELLSSIQQQSQVTSAAIGRLDTIAQGMDYLYEQMGTLGQLLLEDGEMPHEYPIQTQMPPTARPSLGQAVGQWAGQQFDHLMYGQRGGGRPRSR